MSSNKDEPRFGPNPRQVDDHLIETFGSLPDEAPIPCFSDFDPLKQRSRGCQQCAVFGSCKNYSFFKQPKPEDSIESDPNGTPQHAPGAKLDAGKTRLWLVFSGFARALEEVGKVGTFGAKKHCDDGWKSVPDGYARYSSAMLRHIMKEARGEAIDPDFGLLHAAHAAWNALARLEILLKENQA
jgi:hypothetical protein